MNEVQELQLKMLLKLDEVCRCHNLRYYIAYGTCIGAVRHKGFIPWDHDVDVLMPVKDAWELTKYKEEFGDRILLRNRKTDASFGNTNMNIVDLDHECIVRKKGVVIEKTNVAMDIYPFYKCPTSRLLFTIMVWRSHVYKILVGGIPKNHGLLAKIIGKVFLVLFPEKTRERTIQRIERKLDYNGRSEEISDYYGLDVSICSAIRYKKDWFAKPVELLFEGYSLYGPTDADKYLTKRYGDYMTPVSAAERANEVTMELIEK